MNTILLVLLIIYVTINIVTTTIYALVGNGEFRGYITNLLFGTVFVLSYLFDELSDFIQGK